MPPPPPPPPPPGPGPPPAPTFAQTKSKLPDRKGLLGDIAKGKQLKKAITNDRSAPQVAGGVIPSSSGSTGLGRPPIVPTVHDNAIQGPHVEAQLPVAPQLGGLFAGGMPTLRKTSRAALDSTTEHEEIQLHARTTGRSTTQPANANTLSAPHRAQPQIPNSRPQITASHSNVAGVLGNPPLPSGAPPIPPTVISSPKMTTGTKISQPMSKPPAPPPPPPPPVAQPTTTVRNDVGQRDGSAYHNFDNANTLTTTMTRPPSLPTAPPPPLPVSVHPAPELPQSPALVQSPGRLVPITKQADTLLAPTSTPIISASESPRRVPSTSALDGLQAALADRGGSRSNQIMSEHTTAQASVTKPEKGYDSLSYSLKAQHAKRIDDSRYRFQPDNALPVIRPYINCAKLFKSGRKGGSTVPLNLDSLR